MMDNNVVKKTSGIKVLQSDAMAKVLITEVPRARVTFFSK